MQDFTPYLRAAIAGPLRPDQAAHAFSMMVNGDVAIEPMAAFLAVIETRGASEDELFSIAGIIRDHARPVASPDHCLDTCGTGGDGSGSFNVSTAAALVLAGCSVPVAKHGNRAQTSRCGSADVLEALGVRLDAPQECQEQSLRQASIAFFMAPFYHPVMKAVAPARRALKIRTIFNLIGPLVNPCRPVYQLVGVYSRRWLVPIAKVLGRLGSKRVWVVHGEDESGSGIDEVSLGRTWVAQWDGGNIREFTLDGGDGLLPVDRMKGHKKGIDGGDAATNAAILRSVLAGDGRYPDARDMVLINAAAGLCVAGQCADLAQGVERAKAAIDDGSALAALTAMIAISHGAKTRDGKVSMPGNDNKER